MYCFTFVLITVMSLQVTAIGPRCFECSRIPFPRDCDHVKECGDHEICYTKQIVSDSGHVYYDTGCIDKMNCNTKRSVHDALSQTNDVTSPLHDETGDLITCLSCCHGEFCNSAGCGTEAVPSANRGPICFSCPKGSSSPGQCDKITTCGRDQRCGIHLFHGVGGDLLYKTGCTTSCLDVGGTIVGKREALCSVCCDNDFCNSNCSTLNHHVLLNPTKGGNIENTTPTRTTAVWKTSDVFTTSQAPSGSTHENIDKSALCVQIHKNYTYLKEYDHCFKIYNDVKFTWFQSRDRCKKDGGNLFTFHNKREEVYFEKLTEQPTSDWDTKRYWVGATDFEHEGYWTWSDNTKVDATFFFPGEPNNGNSRSEEDCGATAFINRTFLLNDDVCSNQYHFICEISLQDSSRTMIASVDFQAPERPSLKIKHTITTTELGSQCHNKQYSFSPTQGTCFYVHDDRELTMTQARDVCHRENADLLQLRDQNAEQFFQNYGFIDKENNNRRYWLGARKHSDGHFYWFNGKRLDDRFIWAPGEPNNYQGIEECLDFTWFAANGNLHTPEAFALNDDNCNSNHFFICEGNHKGLQKD